VDSASTCALNGEPTAERFGGIPTVPGYEIESELGRGGMGVVYKARDVKLDRTVALKIVIGGGHASSAALARFLAEAKAAAAVRHPGIAQVYEFGEHGGLPFLVLEFCPGGTLADKLAGTPLPQTTAAELVERIASAVHSAHTAGIIHRDLKPANVLLAADGSLRVGDFGLARHSNSSSGLTATGAILGSPSYMAPEQAAGSKEIGPAADVYGLGAILYECLTGRPPFRAATPLETMMQVLKDDPVPPTRLVPKLSRDLETICLKCLRKEPRHRYASAEELAADLRRYLEGRPVAARPAGPVEKMWKATRRRPALAGAIAASMFALIAVVGVIVWKNAELLHERNAARDAERDAELARGVAETQREELRGLSERLSAERDAAEQARTRAEARLVIALDAVDRMLVRTAGEKWARNPALQAERRAVLAEAISVYRSFTAEDSADPRVRRQTALAEARIATAYLALADYEKAAVAITNAEQLQTDLTTRFPLEPEFGNDLALTFIQAGHLHILSGRYGPAEVYYTRAAERARQNMALSPNRGDFTLTLAEALTALGHFNSSRGVEESLKYHRQVVDLTRELARKPGASYGAKLFLAIGLMNVAAPEVAAGRSRGAELLAEAEQVLDSLAGQTAPMARWIDSHDYSRAQLFVLQGTILLQRRQPVAALAKIDAGLGVVDSLLAAQPKSFPYQMLKLNALGFRADICGQLNQPEEAKKSLRELIDLSESIAAASPSMVWVRYRYSVQRSLDLVYRMRDGETADLDRRVADLLALLPRERQPDPARNVAADTVRYNVACAYAQAARFGEPADRQMWATKAFESLIALADLGHFTLPGKVALVEKDTDLDPLRDRTDFQQFLARVKGSRPMTAPAPREVIR